MTNPTRHIKATSMMIDAAMERVLNIPRDTVRTIVEAALNAKPDERKLVTCINGHRSSVPVPAFGAGGGATHTCPVCNAGVPGPALEYIPETVLRIGDEFTRDGTTYRVVEKPSSDGEVALCLRVSPPTI